MKTIIKIIIITTLVIYPISINAKHLKTEKFIKEGFSFKMDSDYWKVNKDDQFAEGSTKEWKSDCGRISITIEDNYKWCKEWDSTIKNRRTCNFKKLYNNDFIKQVKEDVDDQNEKIILDKVYYTNYKMKFIKFEATDTRYHEAKQYLEQYNTMYNGYYIYITFVYQVGEETGVCTNSIQDITKTMKPTGFRLMNSIYDYSIYDYLWILLISIPVFIIYPSIKAITKTNNKRKRDNILNSTIGGILFIMLITFIFGFNYLLLIIPILYYFVNKIVWKSNGKDINVLNKDNNIKLQSEYKKSINNEELDPMLFEIFESVLNEFNRRNQIVEYCNNQGMLKPIDFKEVIKETEKIKKELENNRSKTSKLINSEAKNECNVIIEKFIELIELELEMDKKLQRKADGNLFEYNYSSFRKDNKKANKMSKEINNKINMLGDLLVENAMYNIEAVMHNITNVVEEQNENEEFEKEEAIKDINNLEKPKHNKKSNMDKKYNDLNKIKELLDKEIITQEEFEKEKKKILNKN